MGWETDLFCNISYYKETFNTKSEVEDKIEELKSCIETNKNRIRTLVMMTEPKKFCEEDEDPMYWLDNTYTDSIEVLEEYYVDLFKLELLLDNWDNCHDINGLGIAPPDNINWDTAYIDGDFVKTNKSK